MSRADRIRALAQTAKQREFEHDFLASWEEHVTWEEAPMRRPIADDRVFVVEEEDVLAYNRALGETDPLLVDPRHAREHAPDGTVLVHPLFTTTIAFWFATPGTSGSWIRTPGARNPFQRVEIHDRIQVGDRISVVHENSDRFIRRGQHYLTTHAALRDQHGTVKAEAWGTLILPPTREEARFFANLMREQDA